MNHQRMLVFGAWGAWVCSMFGAHSVRAETYQRLDTLKAREAYAKCLEGISRFHVNRSCGSISTKPTPNAPPSTDHTQEFVKEYSTRKGDIRIFSCQDVTDEKRFHQVIPLEGNQMAYCAIDTKGRAEAYVFNRKLVGINTGSILKLKNGDSESYLRLGNFWTKKNGETWNEFELEWVHDLEDFENHRNANGVVMTKEALEGKRAQMNKDERNSKGALTSVSSTTDQKVVNACLRAAYPSPSSLRDAVGASHTLFGKDFLQATDVLKNDKLNPKYPVNAEQKSELLQGYMDVKKYCPMFPTMKPTHDWIKSYYGKWMVTLLNELSKENDSLIPQGAGSAGDSLPR